MKKHLVLIEGSDQRRKAETKIKLLAFVAHNIALDHGWWDEERSPAECLCLMHSEISEALEAVRNGYPESEKIPGYGNFVEEIADVLIRAFDLCERMNLDLPGALLAKMAYNETRPHRHGGKEL